MSKPITALIADDEPLLRDTLKRLLAKAWPELVVIAEARNGREAVELFSLEQPDVCFLDVHMPGLSGVEAAQRIARRAHIVFVTAYNQYALQAFDEGALDYLIKPVQATRLADTVARLKERIRQSRPVIEDNGLLLQLVAKLKQAIDAERPGLPEAATGGHLQWIRAAVGQSVRLIFVKDIDYLRADEKYTVVAWRNEDGKPAEALIRTPLKELIGQLDPAQFAQVHRSTVVNLHAISHVTRGHNETAEIHLKHRNETLRTSRTYLHLFKQM